MSWPNFFTSRALNLYLKNVIIILITKSYSNSMLFTTDAVYISSQMCQITVFLLLLHPWQTYKVSSNCESFQFPHKCAQIRSISKKAAILSSINEYESRHILSSNSTKQIFILIKKNQTLQSFFMVKINTYITFWY